MIIKLYGEHMHTGLDKDRNPVQLRMELVEDGVDILVYRRKNNKWYCSSSMSYNQILANDDYLNQQDPKEEVGKGDSE